MENITQAQLDSIIKLYLAYFNRAPETSGLDFHVTAFLADLSAGLSEEDALENRADNFYAAAVAAPEFSGYSVSQSPEDFVAKIYENVLLRPGAGGAAPTDADIAYWTDRLADGLSRGDLITEFLDAVQNLMVNGTEAEMAIATQVDAVLDNRLAVAREFAKPEYSGSLMGEDAFNAGKAILAGVTADPATAAAAIQSLVDGANSGEVITLTNLIDGVSPIAEAPLKTTTGNDVINGTVRNNLAAEVSTFNTGDIIDGGEGNDTLKVLQTGVGADNPLVATLTSIEQVSVQSLNGGQDISGINWTGVKEIASTNSTADVQIIDLQENATFILDGTKNNAALSVTFSDDVLATKDGVITAEIANTKEATLNVTVGGDDDINTLDVTAEGTLANKLTYNDAGEDLETVTVKGTGALELVADFADLETFDASANSGGVIADLSASGEALAVTGSTGNDDITIQMIGKETTVDLLAGDDRLSLTSVDSEAMLDGGEGTDTLYFLDPGDADFATSTDEFEATISNFEIVQIGNVIEGDSYTVDLANLDDIATVVLDGSDASTGTKEVQTVSITTPADVRGGAVIVEGVTIDILPSASATDIAAAVVAQAAAILLADPTIESITQNGADIIFTYKLSAVAGNVPAVDFVNDPTPLSAGTTFGATASADGVAAVEEVQTFTVNSGSDADGGTFKIGNTVIAVDGNQTNDEVGALIVANKGNIVAGNAGVKDVAYDATTNTVTVTYNSAAGDTANIATDKQTGIAANFGATAEATKGEAGTTEVQTFTVNSNADADGGFIVVDGVLIEIAPNATIDQIGVAISAAEGDLIANNAGIQSVAYDTGTNKVTVVYTKEAGNVTPITAVNDPDNNSSGATIVINETVAGVDGNPGGDLTIDNLVSGGTIKIEGPLEGTTQVIVADAVASAADLVNFEINQEDGASVGTITVADVETIVITTMDADATTDNGPFLAALIANDLETLTVKGDVGVDFTGSGFASLETVDASGVTREGTEGGVTVDFQIAGTFTGGMGDDNVSGSAGDDALSGMDGDDTIFGDLGLDTLTGGAGDDVFVYTAALESNSTDVDVITDFVSGEDVLDFTALGFGAFSYEGEASGYGAVLTGLLAGENRALLDTSTNTLYVDADASGTLDANDFAIKLTGVTDLDGATDFQV